ncbi:MAG: hypothetical protein ACOX4I_08400 [Anaerovoracaceae bacterium]
MQKTKQHLSLRIISVAVCVAVALAMLLTPACTSVAKAADSDAVTFTSYKVYTYREADKGAPPNGEATMDGCHMVIEATFPDELTLSDAQAAADSFVVPGSGISVYGISNIKISVEGNKMIYDSLVTFMPGGIISFDTDVIKGMTCGGKAVYWPQGWKTVVPTGLQFQVIDVTVGTDTTPASTTIQVTKPACVRSMNHLLWTSNGSSILEGAGTEQTTPAHHHIYWSFTPETSARFIQMPTSSVTGSGEYTVTNSGDTVTLAATRAKKGQYLGIYNYDDNFLQQYGFTLDDHVTGLSKQETVESEQSVSDVISRINAIGKVTINSEAAIKAARAAFEQLSTEQQNLITNYDVLTSAENTLAKIKAANALQKKINAARASRTKLYARALKNKRIRLNWKKVSGASGYVVYRATGKNGKFKKVTTIKKASTVKWINKKLRKGRRYYYKVRSFTRISGKTYYGKYSNKVKTKAIR